MALRKNRRRRRRSSLRRNRRRRSSMKMNRRRRRRHSMRPNRRRRRRHSMKSNRRRRMRRNPLSALLGGVDPISGIVKPVLWGAGGFVAARLAGNALSRVGAISGSLGDGWTRVLGNVAALGVALVASKKVSALQQNRGAIITGMGLAMVDNLLAQFGTPWLAGVGDYYTAGMLGEYVEQPLGAYVEVPTSGMGEYVEQPLDGVMHRAYIDPSDQNSIDGLLDVAEAAAGIDQAAAGIDQAAAGIDQAAAGFGLGWAGQGLPQVPSVNTIEPIGVATPITRQMPRNIPITEKFNSPGGRGYAGGIFARNLFSGMMSG